MKKILVVLLILAISAGAVFAQEAEAPAAGTFTWTGEFRFGTDLDFLPDDPVMAPGDGYGLGTLAYTKEALKTTLEFKANQSGKAGTVTGLAEYGDGVNDTESNYKVAGKLKFFDSTTYDVADPFQTLYAYYWFLDRQLQFDVAYKGRDDTAWRASDLVAGAWSNLDGKAGIRLNYKPAFLSGLSAGVALPGLDTKDKLADVYLMKTVFGAQYEVPDLLTVSAMVKLAPKGTKTEAAQLAFNLKVIPDTLTVQGDAEAANLGDFGKQGVIKAGLRAEYTAAPLTAGLELKLAGAPGVYTDWGKAVLKSLRDDAIAAREKAYETATTGMTAAQKKAYDDLLLLGTGKIIGYDDDGSGAPDPTKPIWENQYANLKAYFNDVPALPPDPDPAPPEGIGIGSDNKDTQLAFFSLKPYVYYNIVADTLQARLPVTVAFGISEAAGSKDVKILLVEPGLYWNIARDGAGNEPAKGIWATYSIGYDLDKSDVIKNQLSLKFCWNF